MDTKEETIRISDHEFSQIAYCIEDGVCIIKKFCVDRHLRGKKYGKALLLHCVQNAAERKCTFLKAQDASLRCDQDDGNIYYGIGMTKTETKPLIYRCGRVATALHILKNEELPNISFKEAIIYPTNNL
jgi:GNAT superfamily N-acetyltransferase